MDSTSITCSKCNTYKAYFNTKFNKKDITSILKVALKIFSYLLILPPLIGGISYGIHLRAHRKITPTVTPSTTNTPTNNTTNGSTKPSVPNPPQVNVIPSKGKKHSSPGYVTNEKSTFVGDVHGNIQQILFPLMDKGVVTDTGKKVWINLETLERVSDPSPAKLNQAKLVEIPQLVLNKEYKGEPIIFLGDYVDHAPLEDSLKCFCLLSDLLNQQVQVQKSDSGYESIVSIVGNHEIQMFYDNAGWNLNGNKEVKKKFAQAMKALVADGRMKVSYSRGGVLSTHSCISKIFLSGLLKELTDSNIQEKKAIQYFLDKSQFSHQYETLPCRTIQNRQIHVKKLKLQKSYLAEYQNNLDILSECINKIARDILPKYGKFSDGHPLADRSVLFADFSEGKSKYGKAIGPFWARPNFAGNLEYKNQNHVEPVESIQSAYGHHKIVNMFGRSDIFIKKNGTYQSYEHIVCYDGGASTLHKACYLDCDEKGTLTRHYQ